MGILYEQFFFLHCYFDCLIAIKKKDVKIELSMLFFCFVFHWTGHKRSGNFES